jgi:hypothetical protein
LTWKFELEYLHVERYTRGKGDRKMAQIQIDLGRERARREGERAGLAARTRDAFRGRRRTARHRTATPRRNDAALLATTGWGSLGEGFRTTPAQFR